MFTPDTRILVVDDMMVMRKIVIKSLNKLGLTNIVEADDGSTAWPIIEEAISSQNPIKLIVSDWNMPNMKGVELLKKVRAKEETKNTPFLMVTAEADKEIVLEAFKEKVSSYIVKPFAPNTLEDKLKEIYKKHHS